MRDFLQQNLFLSFFFIKTPWWNWEQKQIKPYPFEWIEEWIVPAQTSWDFGGHLAALSSNRVAVGLVSVRMSPRDPIFSRFLSLRSQQLVRPVLESRRAAKLNYHIIGWGWPARKSLVEGRTRQSSYSCICWLKAKASHKPNADVRQKATHTSKGL